MARHFLIDPPVHTIPTLEDYLGRWPHLKPRQAELARDEAVIEAVLGAHQYFDFHLMLLERVKHKHLERDLPPLDLHFTIRAGAVKNAIIAGVSVIEGVLLFHAQSRGMDLAEKATFGSVLTAWRRNRKKWREIVPIRSELSRLNKVRNRIHLYAQPGINWENVLASEEADLEKVHRCLEFLQRLPTRDRRLPGRVSSFHRARQSKESSHAE